MGPVSTHLGKTTAPLAPRASTSGWRDPRLWIGIALIAASVLIGARVLGAADDMSEVWAVRTDVTRGQPISTSDLVARKVRFADGDDAKGYLPVDQELPEETVLGRNIGSGELLPAAALGPLEQRIVEVPLAVPVENIPSTLVRGSLVDVYVIPEKGVALQGSPAPQATKVLEEVVVIAVPEPDDVMGRMGNRQILVGVAADADEEIGVVLAAARDNRVQFTRRS